MPESKVMKLRRKPGSKWLEQQGCKRNAVGEDDADPLRMVEAFGSEQREMPAVTGIKELARNMLGSVAFLKNPAVACNKGDGIDMQYECNGDRESEKVG